MIRADSDVFMPRRLSVLTKTTRIPTPRGMNFNDGISHDTRHLTHPKAKRARFPESKVQDDKIYTLPERSSLIEKPTTLKTPLHGTKAACEQQKATTVSRSATKFGVNNGRQCQPSISKSQTLCSGMHVVAKIFSKEKKRHANPVSSLRWPIK